MRVLVLTHRLPYPPDKGDRIRGYHWLKALSTEHQVDLLSLVEEDAPDNVRRTLETLVRDVWTVRRRRREIFRQLGSALWTGRSLTEAFFGSRDFAQALGELLSGGDYDVCLAICSSTGAYLLNRVRPQRLIVDLIDVDSVKWQLCSDGQTDLWRWIYRRESGKIRSLERRLASRSETVVTVSEHECDQLRCFAPHATTMAIPNGVDHTYFAPIPDERPIDSVVFVGQMDYFPNVDAVTWFATHVWGELSRRHRQLKWHIVGRNPSRSVKRLARLPNVNVTGAVDDVRGYLHAAISIAPLRIACGVQNKVLEAMSAGRPVIASAAAARGLRIRGQEELLIADDPSEWLAAIELLLSDRDLASDLGARARRAMESRFSWARVEEQMRCCLAGGPVHAEDRRDTIDEMESVYHS